jgi:hypothetical protein
MNHRLISLVFLILQALIMLFIFATWYKYTKNINEYGAEMADTLFGIAWTLTTAYFSFFTMWTYKVYSNNTPKLVGLQLGAIFFFSILTAILLFLELYFPTSFNLLEMLILKLIDLL